MRKERTLTMLAFLVVLVASSSKLEAAFHDNLELYYTYDTGTVSSTVVTDQWTVDGDADNVARNSLTTFTTGAKFGQANHVIAAVNNPGATPRYGSAVDTLINPTFMPQTGNWTLSFWYRQGNTNNNQIWGAGARGNDTNNDDGLRLYLASTGALEVYYHDPAAGGATRDSFSVPNASHSLTTDGTSWNLLNIVRNGIDLSLWVNGSNVGNTTLAPGYDISVNSNTWFREPQFGPDAVVASAAYDDAGVWHRALNSTEIGLIYNGGTGRTIESISIPEPAAFTLSALALFPLGLVGWRRRRRV